MNPQNKNQRAAAALQETCTVWLKGVETELPAHAGTPSIGTLSYIKNRSAADVYLEPDPIEGYYFLRIVGSTQWIAIREHEDAPGYDSTLSTAFDR